MSLEEELRRRTRATWAAGDWDSFAGLIEPCGAVVMERVGIEPGHDVLDVGTGSGGNVAIPAAARGARVVGSDVTPEMFDLARRRAAEAGVEVEWVEADAQDLPFEDSSFDRVLSTFGAMFAPDHARTASELVRVCRPRGRIGMTTWCNDGFAGELFALTGRYMPPPPAGVQPPYLWGEEEHVEQTFGAAAVDVALSREIVDFDFPSVEEMVRHYAEDFGPFVMARAVLEPQGRWDDFLREYGDLVRRFDQADDGGVRIRSDYLLITAER